jgi:hypothetical protein
MRRLALLLLVACGGPGTFTGTVQAHNLKVADSVFLAGREIWLSSVSGFCSALQANTYPKGGTIVKITMDPVETGTFTISTMAGHSAGMQFLPLDDTCNTTLTFGQSIATTGTVNIDDLEAMKSADGRFDVMFTNDHVTGTFNASFCDAPTSYDHPDCK